MKPVIVFDLDGTLFNTKEQNPKTLLCGGIKAMVMTYNALDYLMNDPPSKETFVHGELRSEKPVDIFFLSARSEVHREVTIQNLANLLRDSPASINRRLILGGDGHPDIIYHADEMNAYGGVDVYEAKKECIRLLRLKGYTPMMVFEDDEVAIKAYKDHNPEILILKIIE